MSLPVIIKNQEPKDATQWFPQLARRPSVLRRLTTPSSITEGRLAWLLLWLRPSLSSLPPQPPADREWKILQVLCLTHQAQMP